jgi:hypothetical protein
VEKINIMLTYLFIYLKIIVKNLFKIQNVFFFEYKLNNSTTMFLLGILFNTSQRTFYTDPYW